MTSRDQMLHFTSLASDLAAKIVEAAKASAYPPECAYIAYVFADTVCEAAVFWNRENPDLPPITHDDHLIPLMGTRGEAIDFLSDTGWIGRRREEIK